VIGFTWYNWGAVVLILNATLDCEAAKENKRGRRETEC
jgi:hypothetical protein